MLSSDWVDLFAGCIRIGAFAGRCYPTAETNPASESCASVVQSRWTKFITG